MALFVPNAFRSLEGSAINRELFSNRSMLIGMLITSLLIMCAVYIPILQMAFELTPLSFMDWVLPIGAAFLTLLIIEGIKFVIRSGKKEEDMI
jgi:P-type Ca2+ transporter type 2C